LRYQLLNTEEIPSFIAPLEKLGSKRIIDQYLDTPTAELLKKGIYIRIRNDKKVDIKFNRECLLDPTLELQPYCEEYSYTLPLKAEDIYPLNSVASVIGLQSIHNASFEEFKMVNSLQDHRIVDKIRTSFRQDAFTIVIDEVDQLGTFIEIELMANNLDTLESTKKEMQALLTGLSLKPLTTGYDTLILREHHFNDYIQARFIMDEDKHVRSRT
jgi:adenylate cyclase class IV